MGLSLFFFGICEQLDVFDICVTGHCSSRLAQKLRCPDQLCVCVCVWHCVCTSEQPSIATGGKKYTNTHIHWPFFNTHRYCHEIHFDTDNECVSSCQFISLSLPFMHPLCLILTLFLRLILPFSSSLSGL